MDKPDDELQELRAELANLRRALEQLPAKMENAVRAGLRRGRGDDGLRSRAGR